MPSLTTKWIGRKNDRREDRAAARLVEIRRNEGEARPERDEEARVTQKEAYAVDATASELVAEADDCEVEVHATTSP